MSYVKQFTVSPSFRRASAKALRRISPSSALFTLGAAVYDKGEKCSSRTEWAYYRKIIEAMVKCSKTLLTIEEKHYG